jgi:hypothetical protein
MTDTMTFQNIDLSSWDTLYKVTSRVIFMVDEATMKQLFPLFLRLSSVNHHSTINPYPSVTALTN